MSAASRYDVIVIGAGHNGLTAAALLAKAGRKVVVVERRGVVGGLAACEEFVPGYRTTGMMHDTSCIRPGVVDGLQLERLGLVLSAGPAAVFAPQEKGRGLLLHAEPGDAAAEIRSLSESDAERYAEYKGFLGRIGGFARRVIDELPPGLTSDESSLFRLASDGFAFRRLGRRDMTELLRIGAMCAADWLNEWFEADLLKAVIAGPAIYGSFTGPRSPGTSSGLLRWEALAGRCAAGGPQSVIDALKRAAEANGVEFRMEAEVGSIRVSDGCATGVCLSDGQVIEGPVVAASCDPKRTLLQLVGHQAISTRLQRHVEGIRMRGTTAKVDLALRGPLRFACRPDLAFEFARTGESLDAMERAFDPVKYGLFSERPILDVYIPTVANRDFAPDGHAVASVLVHFAPYALADGWTDERREQLGDAVVAELGRYCADLNQAIAGRRVMTPVDIEERYGVTHGHIHHGEHGIDQLLVRPCPECDRYATPIGGLYLCGSGSHPGGGLTCGPGAGAARAIGSARYS